MMQMLTLVSNLTHANLNNNDTTFPLTQCDMCSYVF